MKNKLSSLFFTRLFVPERHKVALMADRNLIFRSPVRRKKRSGMEISMGMEEQDIMSLEEAFDCLQEVIEDLEGPDLSLEESFARYEQGMKLLKACHEKIDAVEKKVMQMNKAGGLDEF